MYGGYGGGSKGKSGDSPSESGGRFGGSGLGSPSKSSSSKSGSSKSSSTSSRDSGRSVQSARSDTPSSGRSSLSGGSKGGLGTASRAGTTGTSRAGTADAAGRTRMGSVDRGGPATGYSLSGRSRMGGVERNGPTTVSVDRARTTGPATGFNLSGRTRMSAMDRYARPSNEVTNAVDRTTARTRMTSVDRPSTAQPTKGLGTNVPPSMIDAPGLVSRPVSPTGFTPSGLKAQPASALPDLTTAPKATVSYPAGATRPTTDVADRIAASWAAELGADNVRITMTPHGGLRTSAKGARSGRHGPTVGSAMDYGVQVKGPGGWTSLNFGNADDKALADRVAVRGARDFGLKGYGSGNGYMSNAAIHHDIVAAPRTGGFEWTGKAARSAGVPQSTRSALASARAAYEAARKAGVPTAQRSVASILSTARDEDAAIAALNQASGAAGAPRATAVASAAPAATTTEVARAAPEMAGATLAAVPADASFPRQPSVPRPDAPTLNLPNRAPKPTLRDAPAYKRSGLGEVGAAGVDVLVGGMGGIPGLVAQGASYVLTGKSIGGNVVDYVSTHENYYQPGESNRPDAGSQSNRGTSTVRAKPTTGGTDESTASTFSEKYIDFYDPTPRPTPEQRWDWRSSKYIGVG